jgi:soluble lytic murein transglycosylase-like protein
MVFAVHPISSPTRRSALKQLGALGAVGTMATGMPTDGWAATRVADVPRGYWWVGQRSGVPGQLLYCVAAQESVMRFGDRSLPYPWTLCARGTPLRFESYAATVNALEQLLQAGVTNVDCGAMQVNWHWHAERLVTPRQALDPYPNLRVGAALLKEHALATGDWFKAVGRYHHPSNSERATRYAQGVFARLNKLMGGHGVQRG